MHDLVHHFDLHTHMTAGYCGQTSKIWPLDKVQVNNTLIQCIIRVNAIIKLLEIKHLQFSITKDRSIIPCNSYCPILSFEKTYFQKHHIHSSQKRNIFMLTSTLVAELYSEYKSTLHFFNKPNPVRHYFHSWIPLQKTFHLTKSFISSDSTCWWEK